MCTAAAPSQSWCRFLRLSVSPKGFLVQVLTKIDFKLQCFIL